MFGVTLGPFFKKRGGVKQTNKQTNTCHLLKSRSHDDFFFLSLHFTPPERKPWIIYLACALFLMSPWKQTTFLTLQNTNQCFFMPGLSSRPQTSSTAAGFFLLFLYRAFSATAFWLPSMTPHLLGLQTRGAVSLFNSPRVRGLQPFLFNVLPFSSPFLGWECMIISLQFVFLSFLGGLHSLVQRTVDEGDNAPEGSV